MYGGYQNTKKRVDAVEMREIYDPWFGLVKIELDTYLILCILSSIMEIAIGFS